MSNQTHPTGLNGNVNERMNRLTAETAAPYEAAQPAAPAGDGANSSLLLEQMRPTLLLFLGGTGQLTAVQIKATLIRRFGDNWRRKVHLLAFDTTEEPAAAPLAGTIVQLEAGSEFFNIGNVPIAGIVRNIDNLHAIRERLGDVITQLSASVMRSGAKQARPLGLLAWLWHFPTVAEELRKAIWRLAGRDAAGMTTALLPQGINVFICGSLVGGTCSGTFLDAAYLVRSLCDELGPQGEFCHITGIGLLPQAFPGVAGPNLYPNAGAALKELNHAMVHGDFVARYPDGREIAIPDAPFNLFYVLDGVDERGQTWASLEEVTAMAAEGIYLQMASQLGRKGDNAFDNVDGILIGRTDEGDGTFLASFGLGYLEFPAPAVARLCGRWLLQTLIQEQWLRPADVEQARSQADSLLHAVAAVHLQPTLLRDPQTGGELRLDLRQPGWLAERRADEVATAAAHYVRDYGQARVNEAILGQIEQNSLATARREQERWHAWVNEGLFAPGVTIWQVHAVLQAAGAQLAAWMGEARRQLGEQEREQERLATAVAQLESSVARAATSLPLGRGGRIREALARYFQAAQALYEGQLQQAQTRAQLRIWSELQGSVAQLGRAVQNLADRLAAIAAQGESVVAEQLQQLQAGGVSRLSLADETYVRALYQRHAPQQINLLALLEGATESDPAEPLTPLALATLSTHSLTGQLLAALQRPFAPIARLTVEAVIEERAGEMTPQARRQQLFRLATPSWSVDRARLPEGGAGLVRLEVMGVPDTSRTLFAAESMLVSTHDPHRLVALVVTAGAPQSALQQYGLYQAALDRARRQRPMHVLPHFITDGSQARLAFALGSIFDLVYNQGTHFYYRPTDRLQNPIRLGNGLANVLRAFTAHETLAREALERVEGQIAQLGSQRAIEILTAYVTAVPDNRQKVDDTTRELKRLVRDYTQELRQINEFNRGLGKG